MNNSDKDANLKEKLKQALSSTFKVISDDFKINNKSEKNQSSEKFNFFEIDNLSTKNDFIRARAETDSSALKKNFLMRKYIKETYHLIHLVDHYTH